MAQLSSADHSVSPPRVTIPRRYNAAHDLIERNLAAGRGERIAFIDDRGSISYAELARRVNRFASSLAGLGLRPEDRVMVCMLDTIDWPVAFLGAIKAGVVPVAVNTLLKPQDYEYMLRDSRARVLFVSQALLPSFEGWRAGCRPSPAPSCRAHRAPHRASLRPTSSVRWSPAAANTSSRPTRWPTNRASGSTRPVPPALRKARFTFIRA